ncbi:hypothetical protein M404DRAFT_18520 [Pisolithus tinctorius Marx 270]|uniref:Uncharacterized protein n=1 Tax=Pisolithus tinctorius Marx 270 TaxID=870435 RepID=A0A0C3PXX3_PISTI|nr:hypothetical protein M404DRAFT_18520 [Pisolithus tinctorius Marx 270]
MVGDRRIFSGDCRRQSIFGSPTSTLSFILRQLESYEAHYAREASLRASSLPGPVLMGSATYQKSSGESSVLHDHVHVGERRQ